MKLSLTILPAALIIVCLMPARAQAQLGVYASFDAAKFNSSTNWVYGPGFGAYLDHGHFGFLSAGVDARGQILGGNGATRFDAGYIGPRIALRPHVVPIKPYIEALAGTGYAHFDRGASEVGATKFSYQFVGGVDYTILPRIDWRVVEFSYGGLSILNGSLNPKVVSTGIVIRLPGIL